MTEWLDVGVREQGNGGKTIVRNLEQISDSSKKADKDLKKLGSSAAVVGGIIGAALGSVIGAGLTIISSGFKNAAMSIKETITYSKQLGETAQTFSQLDFAAQSYDVTTKSLASSMEQLQAAQVEAAKPGKEMNKIFDQLDISATNADGSLRKTSEVLYDVADIFKSMPDGTNKSALAMKLFGNENRELIGLLNQGSQGLREMANKSDELGYTVSQVAERDVKAFYDQLDDVTLQIQAMYRQALPTLLPYLQQFGNLLNSQEFKDGFNTIIQGAANAVVWLAKMSVAFVNTIRTLSENVAARAGGAALDDSVRVNGELDRIEARIEKLQDWQSKGRIGQAFSGKGRADPYAAGRDPSLNNPLARAETQAQKELNILTERRGVLLQAQRDIAATEWTAQQADIDETRAALDAADKAAAEAKKNADAAAKVDWTKLGRDPAKAKSGTDDAARELRRLLSDYEAIVAIADPVLAAQERMADAEDVLAKAVKRGWLEQEKANQLKEQYKFVMKDQLDPLAAMNEELAREAKLVGLTNDEREIQADVLNRVNQLKLQGKELNAQEIKDLEEQLRGLQKVNDEMTRRESIRANSGAGQMKEFGLDLGAFGKEQEGMSDGDKFNWLNQQLGGTLDETQAAIDARLEQLDLFYQMVTQFRDADVRNAQLAAAAMNAIEQERMDIRVQQVQTGLTAISGLMSSHNKTAFKIGQAAAIANATITGITTAMNAYESASKIPYVGWILGPLAAAGAAAAAAASISKIRSQQPPAYRTGGEYVVGGSGGTDSQNVHLRATPRERITINTPGQATAMERIERNMAAMGAGGGGTQNFNLTVVQSGRPDSTTPGQTARQSRKQFVKMAK